MSITASDFAATLQSGTASRTIAFDTSRPLPVHLRGEGRGRRFCEAEGEGQPLARNHVSNINAAAVERTERVAAPHPNPLPVKYGERG